MRSLREIVMNELHRRERVVSSNQSAITSCDDGERKILDAVKGLPADLVQIAASAIRSKKQRIKDRLGRQEKAAKDFAKDAEELGILVKSPAFSQATEEELA